VANQSPVFSLSSPLPPKKCTRELPSIHRFLMVYHPSTRIHLGQACASDDWILCYPTAQASMGEDILDCGALARLFFFFRIGLDRYGLSTRTRHVSAGRKRKAFGNGSCRTEGQKSKLDSLTADHTIRLDLTDPGIQTKTRHHVSAERGEKARGDTSFRTEERERARQLDSRWND